MAAYVDVSPFISACEEVAQEVLSNEDEWEKRDAAVLRLAELFSGADHLAGAPQDDLKALWRVLKEPLKRVVTDLRSELVRDACEALEALVGATRDGFRPLLRDLMPSLVQNLANGNKVIQRQCDESLQVLLHECRWRGALPILSEKLTQSRSKLQRESCSRLLDVVLTEWPAKVFSDQGSLEAGAAAVVAGVSDASEIVRRQSRKNFVTFYRKTRDCQRKAEELMVDMEPRLVGQLRAALADETLETPQIESGGFSLDQSYGLDSVTSKSTVGETQDSAAHDEAHVAANLSVTSPARSATKSDSSEAKQAQTKMARASSNTSPMATHAQELESIPFEEGDQVTVKSLKPPNVGTVRYVGVTAFATGVWVGIALPHPSGKNNGTVQGEQYFECPDKHGLFVRPKNVEKATDQDNNDDDDENVSKDTNLAADPEAEERLRQASHRMVEFCRCYVKDVLLDMQSLIDAVDKCSLRTGSVKIDESGVTGDAKEALDNLLDALSRTMSKVAPSQRDADEVIRLSKEDLKPS